MLVFNAADDVNAGQEAQWNNASILFSLLILTMKNFVILSPISPCFPCLFVAFPTNHCTCIPKLLGRMVFYSRAISVRFIHGTSTGISSLKVLSLFSARLPRSSYGGQEDGQFEKLTDKLDCSKAKSFRGLWKPECTKTEALRDRMQSRFHH